MNKTAIPKDPSIRWEWIKYQLRAHGSSLAKVARALGVTAQAVKNAKRLPYPNVERAIAKALNHQPVELWPERWSADGKPRRIRTKRAETNANSSQKHTAAYANGHRKTGTEG